MKTFLSVALLFVSIGAHAEIIEVPAASITRVTGYDDFLNGAVIIALDQNHSACPIGAYINPSSPGATTLVALITAAYMSSHRVQLQLYTDRIQAGRCEVDAVSVLPS